MSELHQQSKLRYALKQFVPPIARAAWRAVSPPAANVSKRIFDQELRFAVDWFTANEHNLDRILSDLKPSRAIEVGSFEGLSTCFLIERIASERPLELHAIDTWQGGIEHSPGGASEIDMRRVERTFLKNTGKCVDKAPHTVDFHVHKCSSHQALSRLIAEGREQQFDLIYIDGSHQAPDVLADAILSFKLLRVGGIMIFDDYLWEEPLPGGTDPLRNPKLAIDAFVNVYIRKLNVLSAPLEQLYVRKVSE